MTLNLLSRCAPRNGHQQGSLSTLRMASTEARALLAETRCSYCVRSQPKKRKWQRYAKFPNFGFLSL